MSTSFSNVELYLPLDFLEEALMTCGIDGAKSVKRKGTCQTPEHEAIDQISLTSVKLENHLKIVFDKFSLYCIDDVLQCKIFIADSELQSGKITDSVSQERQVESEMCKNNPNSVNKDKSVGVIRKRKRGRPRKTRLEPRIAKERGNVKDEIICRSSTELRERKENVDLNEVVTTDKTRYSLRGRKLNSQVMAFVKGSDENSETNDDEDDIWDYETDIDAGNKNSLSKKNVKKHKNTKGSNAKVYYREMRNKVNEILQQGSARLNEVKEYVSSTCNICELKFSDKDALHEHILQMHPDTEKVDLYIKEIISGSNQECTDTKCSMCDVTFKDSDSLRNHLVTAHFQCPLCNMQSKSLASLKTHVRNIHIQVGKQAFCHLCTASFRSQGSLKQHIELNHHGNKKVSCKTCKKQFYNNSQLKRHMKKHGLDGGKCFRCDDCGKSFSFEYNLKRHIRCVHRPQSEHFHCSYCGKGFTQKVPMISHVQLIHFNLLPYTCKECKNSFPKASLLKEHMHTVHQQVNFEVPVLSKNSIYDKADEDKYYCSFCNDSFTHKIRLIEHMHGDHSDSFPYKCEKCVQGFLDRSFLVLHTFKAHGVLIQDDEVIPAHSDCAGEIMKIITSRDGYPKKVGQIMPLEEHSTDIIGKSREIQVGEINTQPSGNSDGQLTVVAPSGVAASSLLLEVAQGSNTYQYVIESSDSIGQLGSELAVDIANLLLAAEKSTQEVQPSDPEVMAQASEEINLIIQNSVQNEVSTDGTNSQTVEVLLSQDDQNNSLLTSDNQSNQSMEVVIGETENDRAVFTIENQAQTADIEHGDIIELNDSSSEGRNYYRIVNVLDNQ